MIYPEDIKYLSSESYANLSFKKESFNPLVKTPNQFESSKDIDSKLFESQKELEANLVALLDYAKDHQKSTLRNLNLSYFFEIDSNKEKPYLNSWLSGNLKLIKRQDEPLKKVFSSKLLGILKLVSEDYNFSKAFFRELELQDSHFKTTLRLYLFKKLQESKSKEFKVECLKSLYSLSLIREIVENLNLLKNEVNYLKDENSIQSDDFLISKLLPWRIEDLIVSKSLSGRLIVLL